MSSEQVSIVSYLDSGQKMLDHGDVGSHVSDLGLAEMRRQSDSFFVHKVDDGVEACDEGLVDFEKRNDAIWRNEFDVGPLANIEWKGSHSEERLNSKTVGKVVHEGLFICWWRFRDDKITKNSLRYGVKRDTSSQSWAAFIDKASVTNWVITPALLISERPFEFCRELLGNDRINNTLVQNHIKLI